MLEKNPFLRNSSVKTNLDFGDPKFQEMPEVKEPKDDFVSRAEKNYETKPVAYDGETFMKPLSKIDFNKVDGEDISGTSRSVDGGDGFFKSEGFKKGANAGLTALQELPGIINNFQTTPESHKEATGKVLSLASSGANIGASFGPLGAGIGAVVGAGAGLISNSKWEQKLVKKEDDAAIERNEDEIAERQQNYFLNKTAEQIKAEMNLFKEAQGYIV